MRRIDLQHEQEFENNKVLGDDARKNQGKFYKVVKEKIDKHQRNILIHIRGLNVLEIGCSSGADAELYASSCKKYSGIDISDIGIRIAKERGIPNAHFIAGDAHHLPFKNNQFDVIIVNSLLHHLNLEQIFCEIQRVVKPCGLLFFREPLGINPVIKLYRHLTPKSRTPDERPFTSHDVRLMLKHVVFVEVEYFGFLSLASAFGVFKRFRQLLALIDELLSKTMLKWFFWQFSGVAQIKKDELLPESRTVR